MTEQMVDLIPTSLAIKAMRDNGYRNTAYAVAELIDNAIQAGASTVELLCHEVELFHGQRTRRNIDEIAVLDNGHGMDRAVLQFALQFGNGTHLDDRTGIGRFGMGLPSSSISQCRRVDVWTWQQGASPIHTYIDLDAVAAGTQVTVPSPNEDSVPERWKAAATAIGPSGTLVVWSTLDRCLWKTAHTIIRNSEHVIGRMYRRFIESGDVAIRLASFVGEGSDFDIDRFAVANDPMYLMSPSSTPAPWHDQPMFRHDGEHWEVDDEIEYNGERHIVTTRFTVAKEEARRQPNAGALPHGKHAKSNIGVSLVRAGRELELDNSLTNQYDPRERWWGVEVEFPPSLDEIFGVTNNKQSARNFTESAIALETVLGDAENLTDLREALREDNDPRGPLLEIVFLINRRLTQLRKLIEIQTQGSRNRAKRHDEQTPESRATEITRERQEKGYKGTSDDEELLPPAERQSALEDELRETGLSAEQAHELAAHTVSRGLKYTFAKADLEGRQFFTVKPVAGEIVIKININHPAYHNLVEVLDEHPQATENIEQVEHRLRRASDGLKLLLMAWARFEDEAFPDSRREEIQDIRTDWGKYAAQFLEGED